MSLKYVNHCIIDFFVTFPAKYLRISDTVALFEKKYKIATRTVNWSFDFSQ